MSQVGPEQAGAAAARPPVARRPDASMSLLSDLMNNTLDEGYRREAERPAAPPVGASRVGRSVALLAAFALAGLVLAAAARQTQASAPVVAEVRNSLIGQVQAETAAADTLQRDLQELRADLDGVRDAALETTTLGSTVRADLESLAVAAGVSPVQGPGIRVVVDDAPEGSAGVPGGTGRVLDSDLQRLLNGLWAAGAEAVSVNGQRLTQLTAVRSAGDAILVAYRPLSPPYEVLAIGDPDNLEVDFVDGPGGRWFSTLEGFGISFDVSQDDELQLPGAAGATLRLAKAGLADEGRAG